MANAVLEKELKSILRNDLVYKINQNYNFYVRIIKLYLNNKFISLSLKNKLKYIKEIISIKTK